MGTTTEEVLLRLNVRDDGSVQVKRFRDQVRGIDDDTRRAVASTNNWAASYRQFGRDAVSAHTSLDRMANRGAVALGALTAAGAAWGLKSAASFELSRTAMGALLGDMRAGSELFDELQRYNVEAPFNMQALASAQQTLLQFGVAGDQALDVLKGLGDIASLTSAPSENLERMALAIGQMSSSGLIRAQDLNQLVQAGFPAYRLLAEITGKTSAQLQQEMETGLTLPAEQYLAHLERMQGAVLSGYKGGAEAASDTLWGTYERFKDQMALDLAAGFEPAIPTIKAQLPVLSSAIADLVTGVAPHLPDLITAVTEFTPVAADLAGAMAEVAGTLAPLVNGAADTIGPDGLEALLYGYLGWRFIGRPIKNLAGRNAAGGAGAAASGSGIAADVAGGAKSVFGKAGSVAKVLGPLEILALGKSAWRTRPEILGGDLAEKTAGMSWVEQLGYQLGVVDAAAPRQAAAAETERKAPGRTSAFGDVHIYNPRNEQDVVNALEAWVRAREDRR
jgi:tape measure domain-containing protein